MEVNNSSNQSYWFVLREDQSNVIFSSNHYTIQNPQITTPEPRYFIETGDKQYIQLNAAVTNTESNNSIKKIKDSEQTKITDVFWNSNKIKLLLTCYKEYTEACTGCDKDSLWEKIALRIGAMAYECKKKYYNLKNTFIRLWRKKCLGKPVKWIHYPLCDEIFKNYKRTENILRSWEESKIRLLLNLYIQNIHKFKDPEILHKDIWKNIASTIGTTECQCYNKFNALKKTYCNWLERTRQTGKLIKWPYKQYFEKIFDEYNPTSGTWNRAKIKKLLESYLELLDKFLSPEFKKKGLWKDISAKICETPENCDKKFRNMKQTYFKLKMRVDTGKSITKWRYFKDFELIYNPDYYNSTIRKSLDDDYAKRILEFYIENLEKFQDPFVKNITLWKLIGKQLSLTPEECHRKFRNLKQTYIRLAEKKKNINGSNKWPYFKYFKKIYDNRLSSSRQSIENPTLPDINKVEKAHEKQDNNKFDKLVQTLQDSNEIQRERNRILQALLVRK